jgi:Ca-activated chloride channel family protein
MQKRFLSYLINLAVILFFFMALANTAMASAFTAEMIEVRRNKTQRSMFYLQDNQYRMDFKEGGNHIAIIVNRNTGKTHLINFVEKIFQEINNDGSMSLINNPFESHAYTLKKYAATVVGTEKIKDIKCNKQEIRSDGKVILTAWISLKYNFPIKIINNLNNYTALLIKIVDGPVDNSLFTVPSGFTRQVDKKSKKTAPKKKVAITGTEKAKAPVGKRLGPGGKIIVTVNPEKHIALFLISESRDAADIVVNASNNGKPVTTNFLKNNINLKKMLDKKEYAFENKLNPDTIEVKVIKGLVRVIVNQESPPWAKEKSKEIFIKECSVGSFVTDLPKKKLVYDIIADSQDHPQSKIKVSLFQGKQKNPIIIETITLENGQKKRYSFSSWNGIASGQIEVKKGDVQFILYPPSAIAEGDPIPAVTEKARPTPEKIIKKDSADKKIEQKKPGKASIDITNVMIILDASGSMWGQVDGKPKIQIAREVLKDLVPEFGADIHLGLSAYGHRRKGDCEDIEILIPIGPNNANAIIKKVNAINPKGKTPLSEATRRAAEALKYTEERAIVLLISDGIETCGADPCKAGAELAMNGIDFITHVISFDVKKEDQVGLRCLAENTGGLFLNASNASELRGALSKTVEKVKETPEPILEEPGDASLEAPDKAPAGSRVKVKWEASKNSRTDFITIVVKDAPEGTYKSYRYTSTGNPVALKVPDEVGLYEIRYLFGRTKATLAKIDLTVTPVAATIDAADSVPVGGNFKFTWTGPNNEGDYIAIVQESADDKQYLNYAYTTIGTPAEIQAPATVGKYQLRYIMGKSRKVIARRDILVSEVSGKVEAKEAVPAGSYIQVIWTGPNNYGDYITIVPKGTAEKIFFNYTYAAKGSPLKLKAPDTPGDFEIRYVLNQSKRVLARTAIKLTKVTAQVNAPDTVKAGAEFQVTWQGPNYISDFVTIVPAGAKEKAYKNYFYTSKGSPATLKAPAKTGKYEVRYLLNQSRTVLARTSITVN